MAGRKVYPVSKIDSDDTKIELNCRITKPLLLYFREKYGHEKLEEFIYETKMNLDYLEDGNNWISYDYWRRLLAKLVEYTGDPRAPFTVGTYTAKKECFGILQTFFSRFGTPSSTYKLGIEFTTTYNKIADVKILNLKRNSCTIRTSHFYGQDKNNCLNLQGIWASVPTLWNLPLAKVKHPQCAAEGADSCIYEISWRNKPSHLFGLWGLFIGIISLFVIKLFFWATGNNLILITIPILGYSIGRIKDYKVTLRDSMEVNERESKDVLESIETIEKLNADLQGKIEQRTEELDNSNKKLKKAMFELKNSQNQLIQSEKMATVGRLAAGMAHELNNPVGAVRNYIQDVQEDTPQDDSRWQRLKRAESATDRCKRIVSDLLTFARESKELKLVDINDVIEITVSNATEEISNPRIEILKELESALPKIKVDPLQIQQVFMNIVMNSSEAMQEEGKIIIKSLKNPDSILVEISDTGSGIPEDIQDKIFDPFFTTKPPGKGMGLGLAISYNIIKRFNGDIRVKSKKDKGAVFTVILPIIDGKEQ